MRSPVAGCANCSRSGVQVIPAVAGQARLALQSAARLVQRIADQRMPRMREMNAHLVRPSGGDVDVEQRAPESALEHRRYAVRRLTVLAGSRHCSEQWMRHRADRHVDHQPFAPRLTKRKSAVGLRDDVFAPRPRQRRRCRVVAREQHQPGRMPPKTMKRARLGILLPHQRQQGVIEVAAGRQRRQPARFVDRDDRLVLMEDGVVGRHFGFVPWRAMPGDCLTGIQDDAAPHALALDFHFAALDALRPTLRWSSDGAWRRGNRGR